MSDASNVVRFTGITRLDLPVEQILDRANEAGLTEVVIVGYNADGDEFFASSKADAAQVMYHMQRAIHRLNCIIDRGGKDDGSGYG